MIFCEAKSASEFSDLERNFIILERSLDLNAASKNFLLLDSWLSPGFFKYLCRIEAVSYTHLPLPTTPYV